MITQLNLRNFKCYQNTVSVPLNRVNLFTGMNGSGKSSALQSILFLYQSIERLKLANQWVLNGLYTELGNFNDIRNRSTPKGAPIELCFYIQQPGETPRTLFYHLSENESDDMVAEIDGQLYPRSENASDDMVSEIEGQQDLDIIQNHCHYISADRIGPREFYLKQSLMEFPNVGKKGEFTASVLSKLKDKPIYEELRLPEAETYTLIDQTVAWLRRIFKGGSLRIKPIEANIILMEMNSDDSINFFKPSHVGFGYSYSLPIIVAGLVAKKGDILIVENPEAHLHPAAQAQLTRFLATVGACGIQVIIESHSDHILNGLRVAILDQIIPTEITSILYFGKQPTESVAKIPVASDGSIHQWPEGFFDQTNKDFERLFGV